MYKKYKLDEKKTVKVNKIVEFSKVRDNVKRYCYATFAKTAQKGVYDILFLAGDLAGRLYINVKVPHKEVINGEYLFSSNHTERVVINGYKHEVNYHEPISSFSRDIPLPFYSGKNDRITGQLNLDKDVEKITIAQLRELCRIKNHDDIATKKERAEYDNRLKEERREFEELLER